MPTKLDDLEELNFQSWIRQTPWFKNFISTYGEAPDLDTPDYDYRMAWKKGITPQPYEYDKGQYHWPSAADGVNLKGANHPTMWMEEYMKATGVDPNSIGVTKDSIGHKVGLNGYLAGNYPIFGLNNPPPFGFRKTGK